MAVLCRYIREVDSWHFSDCFIEMEDAVDNKGTAFTYATTGFAPRTTRNTQRATGATAPGNNPSCGCRAATVALGRFMAWSRARPSAQSRLYENRCVTEARDYFSYEGQLQRSESSIPEKLRQMDGHLSIGGEQNEKMTDGGRQLFITRTTLTDHRETVSVSRGRDGGRLQLVPTTGGSTNCPSRRCEGSEVNLTPRLKSTSFRPFRVTHGVK